MNLAIARTRVLRFRSGSEAPAVETDELAVEEPLEIRISGEPYAVTMRTPGHDVQLAAGYLLTEGVLTAGDDLLLRQEGPNAVNVAGLPRRQALVRESVVAASCGICGRGSIDQIHRQFSPLPLTAGDPAITPPMLEEMLAGLESGQAGFVRTGGAHAAALFDCKGALLALNEDVGRHNAVDKVIGYALLKHLVPLDAHVLLVSGRVSFEIVQKALAARIPVIAAVSAPSSLAVEFAEANGQTLIGFARSGRCNVYSHDERFQCSR